MQRQTIRSKYSEEGVPSPVYIYKLKAEKEDVSRRLVLAGRYSASPGGVLGADGPPF